jgi:hypothetical protein
MEAFEMLRLMGMFAMNCWTSVFKPGISTDMAPKQLSIAFCILGLAAVSALAHSVSLTTVQNSNLTVRAATLLTNGVHGLTNNPATFMVSGVNASSSNGGQVVLTKKRAWVRRYNSPANSEDQAIHSAADQAGNVVVTGYSVGQGTSYDFATVKYSALGVPLWTNRYDGPAHLDDYVRRVAVDSAGNVYVAGDSASGTRRDVAVVKYSSNGARLWARRFNSRGTNTVYLNAMVVDRSGNVFFSPFDTDNPNRGIVTIKMNTSGIPLWTNRFDSSIPISDHLNDMAVDYAGNLFVTGNSGTGYVTLKYAPNGTALWTNRCAAGDIASDIAIDAHGNVIITGDDMGSPRKYVTVKYSNSGTPLWTNILAAASYQGGNVPAVVTDARRNVFIAGGSAGAQGANSDFRILKLSRDGVPIWTNRFFQPNIGNGFLGGVCVDVIGNFYLTAHSTDVHGRNYITAKYGGNGGFLLWRDRYNGPANGHDYSTSIVTGPGGNVVVTGGSDGGVTQGDFATIGYIDYITYTPPHNFIGTDTFMFSVSDSLGNMTTATATVSVQDP